MLRAFLSKPATWLLAATVAALAAAAALLVEPPLTDQALSLAGLPLGLAMVALALAARSAPRRQINPARRRLAIPPLQSL